MTAHFNSLNQSAIANVSDGEFVPTRRPGFYRNSGKRVFETMAVVLASPVIILVSLILILPIVLRGESPFYAQRRVGRGGKVFTMWKIRTMVHDADMRLSHYLKENPTAREEWARHQKLRDDPRVTTYGRFLRRTSLDELPQFWNFLRGEMALVGPRPMMPHQRPLYPGMAYFALRPGISGFWQVSDRNDCEFEARAAFDDLYDRELSFVTDLLVIFRTFAAVARGTGV